MTDRNSSSDMETTLSLSTRLNSEDNSISITVPLNITLKLGGAVSAQARAEEAFDESLESISFEGGEEAISINPDYSDREGYSPIFLGTGAARVPLPTLSGELMEKVAVRKNASGANAHVLPYHHYSVVMNKERRLAFFTAVNIDGSIHHRIKRDPDKWFYDPRIEKSEQTGNEAYANNPLDRGHLVRRLDPAWGTSKKIAKVANDDTFHFTNCAPQHEDFNQNKETWAGLEDYVLDNADAEDIKISVFSGPVFSDSDFEFQGVLLPKQFWKVVVMVKSNQKLSATAYLLSQENLIEGLEGVFSFGEYKTYQVPVTRIESLTGLDFGKLRDADPLNGQESPIPTELESLREIQF
ncbi:MAG TPA: DNA/RNA non-specific endonuclease [Pyrinomonadaceae bacterium]|nr:DNA/RNA non-specific endonuclease [Pyrinomonadaceae bacterium]